MEKKVGKKVPKHLDDDEDRKNPAYIPRKGLFFEHDLRGQTQEEEVRYVSVPLGLWEGQASLQISLWQQGSLLQWDVLGRSVLLLPALCPAGSLQLFEGEAQKKLCARQQSLLSCFSQIAVGHQQLLGGRSGRQEGCCPWPRNAQAVRRTARNCHILTLQPFASPCVPSPGQRVVSGSCGRMRGAGNTTNSVRMSRPPRPGRS